MKKVIIVFITIVFSTAVYAESSVWKLDADNGSFYLAGSCHVLRKSDYPLPKEFESAYAAADQVIFETDIEALRSPDIRLLMMSKGMYTGGDTLEKKLSKKAYESLVKFCNDRSMSIDFLQNFKPWMAAKLRESGEYEHVGAHRGKTRIASTHASRNRWQRSSPHRRWTRPRFREERHPSRGAKCK